MCTSGSKDRTGTKSKSDDYIPHNAIPSFVSETHQLGELLNVPIWARRVPEADRFRRQAEECRQQAERAKSPLDKEAWLRVAAEVDQAPSKRRSIAQVGPPVGWLWSNSLTFRK